MILSKLIGAWPISCKDLLSMSEIIAIPMLIVSLIDGLLTEKCKIISIFAFVLLSVLVLASVAANYSENANTF